jgi:hypothetical protein
MCCFLLQYVWQMLSLPFCYSEAKRKRLSYSTSEARACPSGNYKSQVAFRQFPLQPAKQAGIFSRCELENRSSPCISTFLTRLWGAAWMHTRLTFQFQCQYKLNKRYFPSQSDQYGSILSWSAVKMRRAQALHTSVWQGSPGCHFGVDGAKFKLLHRLEKGTGTGVLKEFQVGNTCSKACLWHRNCGEQSRGSDEVYLGEDYHLEGCCCPSAMTIAERVLRLTEPHIPWHF